MKRKQLRVCKLCGRPFYSNKKVYCAITCQYLIKAIKKGSRPMSAVFALLLERGDIGARLDSYWRATLLEINWVKPSRDEGDSDYLVLTDWGKEKLKELDKERMKDERNKLTRT